MNKRAATLLLPPLALGALLIGVKWKQMHPTPTQLDLQERAYLSKATKVEIWNPTYRGEVPIADFRNALDDFYLLENDKEESNNIASASQVVFKVKGKGKSSAETEDMAMIIASPLGLYFSFSPASFHQLLTPAPVHPITQHRLQKLAEENISVP